MSTSTYSEELAHEICSQISEGGILTRICVQEGMPSSRTVLRWLDRYEGFRRSYDRAREVRADTWGEDIVEISDDASKDWVDRDRPDGSTDRVLDHEHVTRSKLRVDSRKWLMSKALPKKYGEKLDLNHSGSISDVDFGLEYLSKDELAVIKELLMKAQRLKAAAESGSPAALSLP